MADLQRIAYSHRHAHDFVPQMGDLDGDGNPISICSDDYCTAIRYSNGAIRYRND